MTAEPVSPCLFDSTLLDALSVAARANPRLRQNHNLHGNIREPVQRFFNAIEPGSYVMPHRHLSPCKEETLIMLRGNLGLLVFDATGCVVRTHLLGTDDACCGMHLGVGIWHSVVALTSGTVFFEVKAGPYQPLTEEEKAPWAPAEGSPEAAGWLLAHTRLFDTMHD